jgi:hypothetical protein
VEIGSKCQKCQIYGLSAKKLYNRVPIESSTSSSFSELFILSCTIAKLAASPIEDNSSKSLATLLPLEDGNWKESLFQLSVQDE